MTRLDLRRPAAHLRELAGLSRGEAAAALGGSTTGVDTPEHRERRGELCSLRTLLGRAEAYGLDLRVEVRGRWVLKSIPAACYAPRGWDDGRPVGTYFAGTTRTGHAARYTSRALAESAMVALPASWGPWRPVKVRRKAKG